MTNGFTKRSVGTLTLGEKLKKMRSDKRVSLNEISRATKIRVEYLQWLEEGKYDELPADVYVRGFLKSYGEFLGVDENNLVRLYEKEKGIKRNLEKGKTPKKESLKIKPINISAFVFTPKKFAFFFAATVVFLAFFYLYREAGSLTDTPRLVVLSPNPNLIMEGNSVMLEGKTDKDARVFVNDQLVLVDDEGKFQEEISLQSGINVIHIRAVNKFQKETTENITVEARYEENVVVPDSGNAKDNFSENVSDQSEEEGTLQLELSVDPGPVWVSVEADGKLIFSGTVLAGAVQKFSAYDRIVIGSGRANATRIKLNGKDMGTLGESSGVIKGVVFDK